MHEPNHWVNALFSLLGIPLYHGPRFSRLTFILGTCKSVHNNWTTLKQTSFRNYVRRDIFGVPKQNGSY